MLAQTLLAQKKPEEAVRWLEEHRSWAEAGDEGGGYVYWLARGQYVLGRYSAVTDTLFRFERVYEKDPNLTRVFRLRTEALIKLGLRDNAYTAFASFQERYPDAPEVPDNLLDWARLLVEDGRLAEAEPLLRRLVAEFPNAVATQSGRLWLGRMLMDRQQFEEALGLLDALARPLTAAPDCGRRPGMRWVASRSPRPTSSRRWRPTGRARGRRRSRGCVWKTASAGPD
jgi:TolA-binding protein